MEIKSKFVEFNRFCKDCANKDLDETLDPCNRCLTSPINENSRKPICFEKSKKAPSKKAIG